MQQMRIIEHIRRQEENLVHHEGKCAFDGDAQEYNFVVNVENNGRKSIKLYFQQGNREDMIWFERDSPITLEFVHHTITIFQHAEDAILQPRAIQADLDKIVALHNEIVGVAELGHAMDAMDLG